MDFTLNALGVEVPISVTGAHAAEAAELAREAWGSLYSPTRGSLRKPLPFEVQEAEQVPRFLETLTSRVTLAGIEALAGTHLMLHAAGLSRDGVTLACVGPSGTGKTTLCEHAAGVFDYVTDETVAITDDYRVLPYPKPLSVKVPNRPKQQRHPHSRGLNTTREETRLGAVILLTRDPQAAEARLQRLTLTDALAAIVPEVSYLFRLPDPLTRLARTMGTPRRLVYPDSPAAISLLDAHFDELGEATGHSDAGEDRRRSLEDSAHEIASWRIAARQSRPATHADTSARYVLTAPLTEAIIDYETGLVLTLHGRDFRAISPLAAAILLACEEPASLTHLRAYCVDLFGPAPASSVNAVEAAVETLVGEGLLTLTA